MFASVFFFLFFFVFFLQNLGLEIVKTTNIKLDLR